MANQYKTALQHAADNFPELFDLNIVVLPHAILHKNKLTSVPGGTTKTKCKQILKQFIAEFSQTQLIDNQSLF